MDGMKSDYQTVGRNTIALFVSHLSIKIINFIYIVFLARHLGETGLGQLTFASAFVEVVSILSDFGLTTITVREVSRNRELSGKFLRNIIALRFLLAALVFMVIIAAAHLSGFSGDVLIAIYLYACANVLLSVSFTYQSILNAFEKMQYGSIISTAVTASVSITGLLFIIFGLGVAWFASLQLIWAIPSAIAYMICGKRESLPFGIEFDFSLWRHLIRIAVPVGFGVAMYVVYNRVDLIMLQYMKNDYDVGIYSVAYRMMGSLHFLIWALMVASAPAFSKYFRKEQGKLGALAERCTRYLLFAGIPIAAGGALLASPIMRFLYDGKFAEASGVFSLLALSTAVIFFGATFGTMILNADRAASNFYARVATAGVLFNVILNFLLIPKYTYFGAAVATVATDLLTTLFAFFYVQGKICRVRVAEPIAKSLVAAAVMAIPVMFLRKLDFWLPATILMGAIVYFLAALAFRFFKTEDVRILKDIVLSSGAYKKGSGGAEEK